MDNQIGLNERLLSKDTHTPTEQFPTYDKEKTKKSLLLLGSILIFSSIFGAVGYYLGLNSTRAAVTPTFCSTLDGDKIKDASSSLTSLSNEHVITEVSPQVAENQGWTVFNDQTFSFEYPTTLSLKQNTTDHGNEIELFLTKGNNQSTPNVIISYQEPTNIRFASNKIRTETSNITINNIQAKKFTHIFAHGEMTEIIFEKDGKQIHFWNNFDDISSVNTFDSVTDTFRFN